MLRKWAGGLFCDIIQRLFTKLWKMIFYKVLP